jgi:outer membrane protein assembly factor BamB
MAGVDVGDRTLWRVPGGGPLHKTPAMTDGAVHVRDDLLGPVAVDAARGQERRHLETGGEVCSSPVVADGTVYVGSTDDFPYAIHVSRSWSLSSTPPAVTADIA